MTDHLADTSDTSLDWHSAARRYLERLGAAEYAAFRASKPGKRARYAPSSYHLALIDCLNRNAEEEFKALKALQGYASALGV